MSWRHWKGDRHRFDNQVDQVKFDISKLFFLRYSIRQTRINSSENLQDDLSTS